MISSKLPLNIRGEPYLPPSQWEWSFDYTPSTSEMRWLQHTARQERRKKLEFFTKHVIQLQAIFRGHLYRTKIRPLMTIQKAAKNFLAKRKVTKEKKSIFILQKVVRGGLVRLAIKKDKENDSAIKIQKIMRDYLARHISDVETLDDSSKYAFKKVPIYTEREKRNQLAIEEAIARGDYNKVAEYHRHYSRSPIACIFKECAKIADALQFINDRIQVVLHLQNGEIDEAWNIINIYCNSPYFTELMSLPDVQAVLDQDRTFYAINDAGNESYLQVNQPMSRYKGYSPILVKWLNE